MESIEADYIRHTDWDRVLFNKKQNTIPPKTGWHLLVFSTVAFLHACAIGYWLQWREPERPRTDVSQDALEINFIERTFAPEPVTATSRSSSNASVKKIRTGSFTDIVDASLPAENSDEVSSTGLRLTLDKDEWNLPSINLERNPLKRQHIVLAGRAEPFVKGIKLRDRPTPQQRLAMVGKLFGAVEYDACEEARRRLASGKSQLNEIDLEADLRSIENHCRP